MGIHNFQFYALVWLCSVWPALLFASQNSRARWRACSLNGLLYSSSESKHVNKVSVAPGSLCSVLFWEKYVWSCGLEGRPGKHQLVYTAREAWQAVYCMQGAKAPVAVQEQQLLKLQQSQCSLCSWGSTASLWVQGSVISIKSDYMIFIWREVRESSSASSLSGL